MASTVANRLLSGNDISVHLCKQTAKGAINASPAFLIYRRTEGMGKTTVNYTQSGLVKTNRQARPQIQERSEYSAELSTELSKEGIDNLISAIHSDTETNLAETGTGIAAIADGFTGTGVFTDFAVGDYFWISGFADDSIDGLFRIVTKVSNNEVETYPAPAATETAGATVSIAAWKATSGKAQTYYTVQTRTVDESKAGDIDYHTLYDAIINTFSLEIPDSGICTNTMAMLAEAKVTGTAAISGQTDASPLTDDSVSAVKNILDWWVNGVTQKCEIKSMSLEINNNYQTDFAAGCQGARTAYGDIDVTGSLVVRSMTSSPFTMRDHYEAGDDVSIGVRMSHGGGHETVIIIRSSKITDCTMPTGSNVIANSECSFGAQEDATTASTIQVYRNWQ
jgi:hypothetical protein